MLHIIEWTVSAVLIILGLAYGYAWLKGGNGIWRWRYGDASHKDSLMNPNAPIYGLMSLVALMMGGWYTFLACDTFVSESLRIIERTMVVIPVVTLFLAIAAIRNPWRH